MILRAKILALMIFVLLFGGIATSMFTGWWSTESSKEPARYTTGEAAGEYNPADIRGSYTFGDIEKNFSIPAADLAAAFGLAGDTAASDFQVKNLEGMYVDQAAAGFEIGTNSVRYFVALYKSLPFEVTGEIYLPSTAVAMLQQKAELTPEQLEYLQSHSVDMGSGTLQPPFDQAPVPGTPPAQEASADAAHVEIDRVVKGKTTIQEVLDWGVPGETIENIIGGELPNSLVTIKDYCTENGLDFSTIKTGIQEEIDRIAP